jgi:hypothetical protein
MENGVKRTKYSLLSGPFLFKFIGFKEPVPPDAPLQNRRIPEFSA